MLGTTIGLGRDLFTIARRHWKLVVVLVVVGFLAVRLLSSEADVAKSETKAVKAEAKATTATAKAAQTGAVLSTERRRAQTSQHLQTQATAALEVHNRQAVTAATRARQSAAAAHSAPADPEIAEDGPLDRLFREDRK